MTCPHCGAEVIAGYTFCQSCRKRVIVAGGAPAPAPTNAPATAPPRPAAPAPAPPSTPRVNPYGTPAPRPSAPRPSVPAYAPMQGDTFERPGAVTLTAIADVVLGI